MPQMSTRPRKTTRINFPHLLLKTGIKGVSVLGVTEGLSSDFGSRCGDIKGAAGDIGDHRERNTRTEFYRFFSGGYHEDRKGRVG